MDATIVFSLILFFFIVAAILAAPSDLLTLEAVDHAGATFLMESRNISLCDIVAAIVRGRIRVHLYQEVDPNIILPYPAHKSANSFHSPEAPTQDWEEVTNAALLCTKEVVRYFRDIRDSDGDPRLSLFIQSVILSTFLRLFSRLQITSTNIVDIVWIVSNSWRMEDCWQEPVICPPELCRLIKSSPNPHGLFALFLSTQRLVLAAICTLERRGTTLEFLRRAGIFLRHPTIPEPEVTRLVEDVTRSNPPIQVLHGRLSLGCPPLRRAYHVDFFIPVDFLPPSTCIPGPDGSCTSWLHKLALPSQPACGGRVWSIHATAIILSAIETEIRQAQLTVDSQECEPEEWEEWVLRRLRVG